MDAGADRNVEELEDCVEKCAMILHQGAQSGALSGRGACKKLAKRWKLS